MYVNSVPRVRISPAPPLTPTIQAFTADSGTEHQTRFVDDSHIEGGKTKQSRTKLGHLSKGFLTVAQTAECLGVSYKTVSRWCQLGKLPAITKSYGRKTTYLISVSALAALKDGYAQAEGPVIPKECNEEKPFIAHSEFVTPWIKAMERGLMTGRPFSEATIQDYRYYIDKFLVAQSEISLSNLQTELVNTEIHHYGKRFKMYKAVVCFAKFLIREGALEEAFLGAAKPLYPKRHLPPKRLGVDENQLVQLVLAAKTPLQRMMVVVLAGTGLRVSEAVALRWADVSLEKKTLTVRLGKGNKTRTIGIPPVVESALVLHREDVRSVWVFCDEAGEPLTRTGLYHRLRRIGWRAGVAVSPHALRRAFVTLNANKGRPLQMLQIACGHSDIKTTRSYCLTAEKDVIEAMQGWD